MQKDSPDNLLSIIVPVINEREHITVLLDNLSKQQGLRFELVFADGGSSDGTVEVINELAPSCPFEIMVVQAEPGRGQQLNVGFRHSRGAWLLFLHVDSLFENEHALSQALSMMRREADLDDRPPAGHFPLRFSRADKRQSFAYYFYESKTRTGLPDTIHGDQGLFLSRGQFEQFGPYDESLPILEDCAMSDVVFEKGRWVLLPSELTTSARRFEVEGLLQRQLLNALIMNFRRIGWRRLLTALPEVYRQHSACGRLALLPYWLKIRELLSREHPVARIGLWYATGKYVRAQAWQIYFAFHCHRQFRRGRPVTINGQEIVSRMSGFERMTRNPVGITITSLLVFVWFYSLLLILLVSRRS